MKVKQRNYPNLHFQAFQLQLLDSITFLGKTLTCKRVFLLASRINDCEQTFKETEKIREVGWFSAMKWSRERSDACGLSILWKILPLVVWAVQLVCRHEYWTVFWKCTLQDTNMMNQSMQSMYKATSSGQNSEDEGEHDQITDLSKANEMMQGKLCTCHH